MKLEDCKSIIENFIDNSEELNKLDKMDQDLIESIKSTVQYLNDGKIRVCEKTDHQWVTHQWVKQAILLYFKIKKMKVMEVGEFSFVDKIPLKSWNGNEGVRVVPQALARFGSYISPGCVLMPSYTNIGAWIGTGTMIDTWATVGSCAQVGSNVHVSGGVGIGGVLEPLQASPVIIEDNVFLGSRSIIVEGAKIEEGAVIAAGVVITKTSKIIDVTGPTEKVYQGIVPKNSVVIPGSITKNFKSGNYNVSAALIIGQRSESTDKKTSLNQVLREFDITV